MKSAFIPTFVGLAILLSVSQASATTLYATGFESPTFTTGLVSGQDGWSEYPAPASGVENTFAFAGTQAVSVIPALTTGQGGPVKTVTTAASIVIQSASIYLYSSSTQSGWQFAAVGSGLNGFAGGIDIDPDGTIHAISSGFATIGTFARNVWNTVDLNLDYATQTYSIILNGSTIASNVAFCGNNSGPCNGANVSAYSDGFFDSFGATGVNDMGILDNYSVSTPDTTPLPAALPLFASGLGGLGLLGWRRKRKAALAA